MADIFTHFRNRFTTNPELITTKPSIQKPMETTVDDEANYEIWQQTNIKRAITLWFREELMAHQSSPNNTADGVDFFATKNTKGFRMHPALSPFSDGAVQNFFTYLRGQFIATDFQASLSDTRIFKRGVFVETIHRHVLKPQNEAARFSQAQIELVLKDNKLVALRLEMTVNHTEMPYATDDFADLMDSLMV